MSQISDVTVDKISLVTQEEVPAVAQAKFKIFKTFKKVKITKAQQERLAKILKK